ncbi:hypothetical protein B7495_10915 [Cryobacterium sp. LW097]|uniref:hypothetical protein n=1 Tax=Cryobacterium sp. LW097 TaxID=1978566 RepID=UPI000B4CB9C1|nr:hypothetical protein [Cryobacterium sp. LW097]ASD22535.1 hypothetical protein B7495_10915 [Cryobacterium sp. LW097]
MTAAEVGQELQRFAQLCSDRGAGNIRRMRPGLTSNQLSEIEKKHNLRLPDETRHFATKAMFFCIQDHAG